MAGWTRLAIAGANWACGSNDRLKLWTENGSAFWPGVTGSVHFVYSLSRLSLSLSLSLSRPQTKHAWTHLRIPFKTSLTVQTNGQVALSLTGFNCRTPIKVKLKHLGRVSAESSNPSSRSLRQPQSCSLLLLERVGALLTEKRSDSSLKTKQIKHLSVFHFQSTCCAKTSLFQRLEVSRCSESNSRSRI